MDLFHRKARRDRMDRIERALLEILGTPDEAWMCVSTPITPGLTSWVVQNIATQFIDLASYMRTTPKGPSRFPSFTRAPGERLATILQDVRPRRAYRLVLHGYFNIHGGRADTIVTHESKLGISYLVTTI